MPISKPFSTNWTRASSTTGDAKLMDEFVRLFETALSEKKSPDLADYLPLANHPLYAKILHQLILLDLEASWHQDRPRIFVDYQKRFPEIVMDEEFVDAFDECETRMRKQYVGPDAGEPELREPHDRLDEDRLPATSITSTVFPDDMEPPKRKHKLTDDNGVETPFPPTGTEYRGFTLVALIGQGNFARVYLARQRELQNRFVVLKISREQAGEANVLAQLLHTNIVPVYSVHHTHAFSITCMPYLGTTTLADVLRNVRKEGIPESGKYLVDTLNDHRSTHRSSIGSGPKPESYEGMLDTAIEVSLIEDDYPVRPRTTMILDNLKNLSYGEAVLWLADQLVDGLAHAHDRKILHRDLKPANILLTNEGQPMLLDFNLAEDTKARASQKKPVVGGTLPYMSPEQMRSIGKKPVTVDERSDLYSLGVILYELFTGRFPFPIHRGETRDILPKMLRDRQAGPPRFWKYSKGVTPGTEAIVRKCLHPDPNKRYQNARELEEDIQRQLHHQPLKHARNPSLPERVSKWRKRHPRMASLASVFCLSAVMIVTLLGAVHVREERLQEIAAVEHFRTFEKDWYDAQFLHATNTTYEPNADKLLKHGQRSLGKYAVLRQPNWDRQAHVVYLPAKHRQKLKSDVASLLVMMARAKRCQAWEHTQGEERNTVLREALELNRRAEQNGAATTIGRALWLQRAQIWTALGETKKAAQLQAKAEQQPIQNIRDKYMLARAHMDARRYSKAEPLLRAITLNNPKHIPAWFYLGICHNKQNKAHEALACFTICVTLRPNTSPAYFQRGLAYYRQRNYAAAEADFSKVVELEPKDVNALFNRGLARKKLGQAKLALADVTAALDKKLPYTRAYFVRSRLHKQIGDKQRALTDHQEGLKRTPKDEKSWNSRAYAKITDDPKGALADFYQALQLNPRSYVALHNIAHMLTKSNPADPKALPILDKLIQLYPTRTTARSSRGLLLAALGKREAAHADAKVLLKPGCSSNYTYYRAAEIYALTTQHNPKDRDAALKYLRTALRSGYGLTHFERNPRFASLRTTPEFRRLVAAVRVLREK